MAVLSDQAVEPEAASVAQRTVGLVARETGRPGAARRRLRQAITIAENSGLEARAVEARLSLVLVLLQGGDPAAALAELDHAAARAPSELRGQVLVQRALVHIRLGRFDQALDDSKRALPLLRRQGDRLNEARLLSNRGILRAYRNELGLAEADLKRSDRLYRTLGSEIAAAQVLHNLGYVLALKGDVPKALRHYDQAARSFGEQGLDAPALSVDRAELYLSANLLPEARIQVEIGIAGLETGGNSLDLAEARLLLGQIALAQGDLVVSASAARAARRQLARQARIRWAALAEFVEAQCRWAATPVPARVATEAAELAVALSDQGWPLPSLECRLLGARGALEAGQTQTAGLLVAGVDGQARSGPHALRVRAWYGEALGRLAAGRRSGALSALRAGIAVAEDHRATLGATELRVRTATAVSELAEIGLGLAFDSGRALQVLRWSERWRAGAFSSPRATPPRDPKLAGLLAALRDTVGRLERATTAGEGLEGLADQQRKLEEAIRQQSRGAEGDFDRSLSFPSPPVLREAIGERALVEYVEHQGRLYAVIGQGGRFQLRTLGSAAVAETERIMLHFALGRLARRRSSSQSLDAAAILLERCCRRLGEFLIEPVARYLGERDLIVVPTGPLHALPWALLPLLRGRAMTVSPSVALWYSRQGGERLPPLGSGSQVVFVAGPRLARAEEEIDLIRKALYPKARMLHGSRATAKAVVGALEGRQLAHVAAHGSFRADNPQFSSLELFDGPLTVYDLEGIACTPPLMVLSSCDAGRSAVHPGDELMGTTAAFLALGTRAIVSSAAPVPDDGVSPVMLSLHEELARGVGLARALASAQARAMPSGLEFRDLASSAPASREALAAAAFVCLGAG